MKTEGEAHDIDIPPVNLFSVFMLLSLSAGEVADGSD